MNHVLIAFGVVLKRPRSITSPCWLRVQSWLHTSPRSMPIVSSTWPRFPGYFCDEVLRWLLHGNSLLLLRRTCSSHLSGLMTA